jgi:hypothetical protein
VPPLRCRAWIGSYAEGRAECRFDSASGRLACRAFRLRLARDLYSDAEPPSEEAEAHAVHCRNVSVGGDYHYIARHRAAWSTRTTIHGSSSSE